MNKLQGILAYYLTKLAAEQLSNSTKQSYASLARQFVYFAQDSGSFNENIAVNSFIPIAQKFLSSERNGKASSINARASAIKHFLQTSHIPCETLVRPQTGLTTREPLTEDELNSFLEAAQGFQPRDKAVGMIFAETGIRLSECAVLNLTDVDCIGDSDTIALSIQRSCGRQQIPLNPPTQAALEEYLAIREDQINIDSYGNPLFVDKSGARLSQRALTASVRKIGWAAKLAITPAVLRITRLIQIAGRGHDAVTLAYLAGFDSLEAARRIIRACNNDVTRASIAAEIEGLTDLAEDDNESVKLDFLSPAIQSKTTSPSQAVEQELHSDLCLHPAEEIEIGPALELGARAAVSEPESQSVLCASTESSPQSDKQNNSGMVLGEISDQNYLTVLGRALDIIGWTDEQADNYSATTFGVPHWDELGLSQAEVLIRHLESIYQTARAAF
jgi:site-specific recombinase XerC